MMAVFSKNSSPSRTASSTVSKTMATLFDANVELQQRKMLLATVAMDDGADSDAVVQCLFESASKATAESIYPEKVKQLNTLLKQLQDGPVRSGIFVGLCDAVEQSSAQRAQVMLENGDSAYPLVVDSGLASSLRCGDTVLLDAQARVVLYRGSSVYTGEVAVMRSRIDDQRVEVSLHDHSEDVFRLAAGLKQELDEGKVEPGARLVVCTRRRMALEALPSTDGLSHYRYLVTDPIADVVAERDVGCPPPYIGELIEHVRREMLHPELSRRYRLRRMQTRLLTGVTGSGKTLSMLAVIHGIYELISELTGVPVESLPPRVLQMRSPNILSKWLGASDKNADRFFDEALKLAKEVFIGPDGQKWRLPVICRCEEIDALAKARGTSDAVYDRIQTTLLERLDHLSKNLGDELIIFLFSTNLPQECDTAFLRRAGGEIVPFGRLGRRGFSAVLAKHIRGLPIWLQPGEKQHQAEARLCRDATGWLFSPNGDDPGQLEVTYAGSSTPVVKYRRDVLTGAVIDRSVQQAAKEAARAEHYGDPAPGLTTQMLFSALSEQIDGVCDQVNPFNAHHYLTLPDGVRVGNVRRIEQPSVQFFELERSYR